MNPSIIYRTLSKKETTDLLDFIYKASFCSTETDFRKLVISIKKIIPFESAACLMGRKAEGNCVAQFDLINISYPSEWLLNYVTKQYHLIDPIVKENFNNFDLQYWKDTYRKHSAPTSFLKEAEDFDLYKGYSIGYRNLKATEGSLFSFSGKNIEHNLRSELILKQITPHLHRALNQLLAKESETNSSIVVTSREREILQWLKEGKSTWDISAILEISQDTVNFHLKNLSRKLNTSNRTHTVAVALGMKLIDL
jgi:DNA-binding CsgD family transcriptional regulator